MYKKTLKLVKYPKKLWNQSETKETGFALVQTILLSTNEQGWIITAQTYISYSIWDSH